MVTLGRAPGLKNSVHGIDSDVIGRACQRSLRRAVKAAIGDRLCRAGG